MFVSINEYRNSLNESQIPTTFFDAIRAAADAFDTEYQELGTDFTYFDVDGEVNNVVVLDDNEAMVNGEKMTLQEFINLLTNDEPELLYETKVTEINDSAFHDESQYAISLANEHGFNFSLDQKNNAQYVYTLPVNSGNIASITYKLLRIPGPHRQWRINTIVEFDNVLKNPYKFLAGTPLTAHAHVCDLTIAMPE